MNEPTTEPDNSGNGTGVVMLVVIGAVVSCVAIWIIILL